MNSSVPFTGFASVATVIGFCAGKSIPGPRWKICFQMCKKGAFTPCRAGHYPLLPGGAVLIAFSIGQGRTSLEFPHLYRALPA